VAHCQAAAAIENGEGFVQQVRVLGVRVPPEKLEEVERAYRASLLQITERHEGFNALLLLWDKDTGEALEVTLWEDEEARRSSEEEGGPVPTKMEVLGGIVGERPEIHSYELRIIS
jgi:hypothetical protein